MASSSLTLPPEAASAIRSALVGRNPTDLVLVLAPEGWELETRDSRAAVLRRAGVYSLARQVRRTPVPDGHLLILADLETGTGLLARPLAELLRMADVEPCEAPVVSAILVPVPNITLREAR